MNLNATETVTVLSTVDLTESQLDRLRAVSPRLEIVQEVDATFNELPASLSNRVQILFGQRGPVLGATQYPSLRWVQAQSAGIDYLYDDPIWSSPILITTTVGIHATPIAERAMSLILAFQSQLPMLMALKARCEWLDTKTGWQLFGNSNELRGSTLGIFGYGAVGRELARQASSLGMVVLACNRSGQRQLLQGFAEPGKGDPTAVIPQSIYATAQLNDMLSSCDYVVLVAPLTSDTRYLFGAKAYAAMKPGVYFFNLGRGKLVREIELIEAIQSGRVGGAGLDVFEDEPLPESSPLWKMSNVIISPHIAGISNHYNDRATVLFSENLRRFLADERMINLVER